MTPHHASEIVRVVAGIAIVVGLFDALLLAAWLVHDVLRRPDRPWFSPTWSLAHVWFALQWALMLIGITALAVGLMLGGRVSAGPLIALTIFQNVVFAGVSAWLVFGVYRADAQTIGLRWLPTRRDVRIGVGFGLALCVLGSLMQGASYRALHAVLSSAHLKWLQDASRMFSADQFFPRSEVLSSPALAVSLLIAIGVATPLGEEFMFRALLHRAARMRLGAVWGTLASSAVFALVHAGPLQILAILPMGLALGVAYDRSRSLWVPILMHAVNNTLGVVALYFIPGMR